MKGKIQTYLNRLGASHIAGFCLSVFLLIAAYTAGLAAPVSAYNERLDDLLLKLKDAWPVRGGTRPGFF